ncbi:hypothetical protein HD806DRAFT_521195 [Xylariaceae sp. AK1471]|nr:hypothetical protein HD806DRAFT_521195 [Xylariaceae sp. AK1471]
MTAVADFYIYIFEVHRKDGDNLYGWQFFNGPPTCLQVELAEITFGRGKVRVEGTPHSPLLIEWHNAMGHWGKMDPYQRFSMCGNYLTSRSSRRAAIVVFKRNSSATDYALAGLGGNVRGWCHWNISNTWEYDWGAGFGKGASFLFCVSSLTADAAY